MLAARTMQRAFAPRALPAMPSIQSPISSAGAGLRRTAVQPRLFHASARARAVHELKSEAEFVDTLKEHKAVVVDAFATWCGPCRVISPIFAKLSESYPSVRFCVFDVDDVPDLARTLGIRAMPTFTGFKDGRKDGDVVGANPTSLEQLIRQISE